ncbi:LUD domain-containing protein [Halocalculus aciditolerans]|uniref:4Fe-4S ferredoxin-type domain-containing protein n=1 Tax=Halocalculus aciditolerans TaxID=1383812 RepID=A0A830FMG4_9EURY|nr:LUD domain-containing protein [Halocalculus aciditolerans]GGL70320.1 hypothetical protein GCM10009039_30450 [Halocalculus aciditolerans]
MSSDRQRKAAKIREVMREEGDAVRESAGHHNEMRKDAVARLDDYEDLRDRARAIKEDAIERLPELVDELTDSVEANGGHVYLAEDAADANDYITSVCADADTVVKSKSMTSEEVDVNDALHADGLDVWETDLGELILQVADDSPSHLIGPAMHFTTTEIADLFNDVFDPDEPLETPEELTAFARDLLSEKFAEADVGMTGANFLCADSGSMALVTSEGNARKTVQATDTHIALAGVEKIVPSIEELYPFVELLAKSGTGQDLTSYVTMLSPPVDSPSQGVDGPMTAASADDRDFHLVLLDNGRMDMRDDDHLKETLYCIRCSACSNACANFQHVGGHAFGGETYSGGIGTGWEAGVHGLDSAGEFSDFCTGCSRCTTACPVEIDIPWINEVVRDRVNHQGREEGFDFLVDGLSPDAEPGRLDVEKRLFGNVGLLADAGSATAPLSNLVASFGPARDLMERVTGIDARRDLPEWQRETLQDWFARRGGSTVDEAAASRSAVLYPDVYTDHVQVERGKAAVRVLEALDVHVTIPDLPESGRAPLSQGMIDTADDRASAVYGGLAEHLDAGRDVVVIEPSDLAMFREDYEHFLPDASFERLSENAYEVFEYVYGRLDEGATLDALRAGHERLAYHAHCQQRTLDLAPYTESVLERLGYDLLTTDVECCGMAGSFGYKSEYYELSMDVGEDVREQLSTTDAADRRVVASGTSCLEQLSDLLRKPTRHPIEVVDPRR